MYEGFTYIKWIYEKVKKNGSSNTWNYYTKKEKRKETMKERKKYEKKVQKKNRLSKNRNIWNEIEKN